MLFNPESGFGLRVFALNQPMHNRMGVNDQPSAGWVASAKTDSGRLRSALH